MDQNSGGRHTGHQFDPAQAFTSCWHTGQRAGNEISRKFRNIRRGIFALVAVVGAFNKEKALVESFSKYEIMWKSQRNFVDISKRERYLGWLFGKNLPIIRYHCLQRPGGQHRWPGSSCSIDHCLAAAGDIATILATLLCLSVGWLPYLVSAPGAGTAWGCRGV